MEHDPEDAAWERLEARLADTLAGLQVDEYVVVADPEPPAAPRRGLLRRRAQPPPRRYVQFRRDDETTLYGECVGSTLIGGDWELPADRHAQVRALGWLAPGDPDPTGTQPAVPNYWACLGADGAGPTDGSDPAVRLARMGIGALRLLGADPATLVWEGDLSR